MSPDHTHVTEPCIDPPRGRLSAHRRHHPVTPASYWLVAPGGRAPIGRRCAVHGAWAGDSCRQTRVMLTPARGL